MKNRTLGNSSLQVSPVIFGAWAIGGLMWGGTDEQESIDAIHASLDSGVNTIDTAPMYGLGTSERIVGKAIKGRRDKVIIATKCGRRTDTSHGSDPKEITNVDGTVLTSRSDSRPEALVQECEESLKNLGTDYIDLYQIHWPDKTRDVEPAIEALQQLKKQGKIREIGVCNFEGDYLKRAEAAGELVSLQPPYSLLQRGIEKEIVPFCIEKNIGIICYSPLERGLLTGAVGPTREFSKTDHRSEHKFFTVENRKRVLEALENIKPIADKHKASFAQTIIAWTVQQPGITGALVGARNRQQAEHNAKALSVTLSSEECTAIRTVFDGYFKEAS